MIAPSQRIVKNTSKLVTPLPIVYYFLTAQLLFGIDFGFSAALKKKFRPLAKCTTVTISVIYVILVFLPLMVHDVWFWHNLIEYSTNFLVLTSTKYTLYDHITNAKSFVKITSKDKVIFNLISNVHTLIILFLKIILLILNCNFRSEGDYCDEYGAVYYAFYMIPNLGVDTVSVGQLTILYYIFMCVRNLKESLMKELNFKLMTKRYIKIADLCDKIRPLSDNLILLEIFLGVPKLLLTSWFMLLYIKIRAQWFTFITQVVFASHNAVQILLTAVFAELVNVQIDEIKLLLHEKLVVTIDEKESSEILRILRYLEARKLQRPVWRFIPTGMRLVLSLFNLCITYFIVIIQFTHLYD